MRILHLLTPYEVCYRISGKKTPEGTSQERYDDLTGRLAKLIPALRSGHFEDEAHTSTSSWIVLSPAKSAAALGRALGAKLTPGVDLLEVTEVVPDNRYVMTEEQP